LRARANLEGVYRIIPRNEKSIFESISKGKIRAVYTTEQIPKNIAEKLEFLVLQDVIKGELLNIADVILPSATFMEDSGTIFNSEMKRLQFNKAVPYVGESKPDWKIFSEIAAIYKNLEFEVYEYSEASDLCCTIRINSDSQNTEGLIKKSGDLENWTPNFTLKDFQYRGHHILNYVPDFKALVEYRDHSYHPEDFNYGKDQQ